jgi:tetratricopeptide (TPR) repeat protein
MTAGHAAGPTGGKTPGSPDQGDLINAAWAQVDETRLRTPDSSSSSEIEAAETFSVDGYKIDRKLHQGGQGIVFLATQNSTKRNVAIKLMKEGPFASSSDRSRFELEIQVLGQLRHPSIVTIHDSGSAHGRFYYVMDYIPGQHLDDYMAAERLGIQETIQLFQKICDAVGTAHQRGVIHRDLKPSNIRVDEDGEPHVLDFGLAKVTDESWSGDDTPGQMTITGQFVGSLPWASPEQADGRPSDMDVRTDVYSLGVIFYQMLTDRFPYVVIGGMRQVVDNILNAEPAKPSTIRKSVDDELETIVLKCLNKDPDRRYLNANELARDLHRYAAGEPIEAKRDSNWYVLRKALKRYRVTAAFTAMIALFVVVALIAMIVSYGRESELRLAAENALEEANRQARITVAVNSFLNNDLLDSVVPENRGIDVTVMEVLDAASANISGKFGSEPLVEAAVRATVGLSYLKLGKYDAAKTHMQRALDLRTQAVGSDDPATLESLSNYGILASYAGDWEEADARLRTAFERQKVVHGVEHPRTMETQSELASLLMKQGRYDESEPLTKSLLESRRRVSGEKHIATLTALSNLAMIYGRQSRHEKSLALHREALNLHRETLGDDHPYTMICMNNVASAHWSMGRIAEAAEVFEGLLQKYKDVMGAEHPRTLSVMNNLATAYGRLQRVSEAEALHRAVWETRTRTLGDEHPQTLGSMSNLANICRRERRFDEAEALDRKVLEVRRRMMGERHPKTLTSTSNLALDLMGQEKWDEAEALLDQALVLQLDTLGAKHVSTLTTQGVLGLLYNSTESFEAARAVLAPAAGIARKHHTARKKLVGLLTQRLGVAFAGLGQWNEAEAALKQAIEDLSRYPSNTEETIAHLNKVYEAQGKKERFTPAP